MTKKFSTKQAATVFARVTRNARDESFKTAFISKDGTQTVCDRTRLYKLFQPLGQIQTAPEAPFDDTRVIVPAMRFSECENAQQMEQGARAALEMDYMPIQTPDAAHIMSFCKAHRKADARLMLDSVGINAHYIKDTLQIFPDGVWYIARRNAQKKPVFVVSEHGIAMVLPIVVAADAVDKIRQRMQEADPNRVCKEAESAAQEAEKPETIDLNALTAENLKDYLPALLLQLANDKHNSSIILAAGIEAGVISPQALLAYFQTGCMPDVHTFDVWGKAGYIVKKGEKARFAARIWKHISKFATLSAEEAAALSIDDLEFHEGDEIPRGQFIKKTAYFFTADQVEKLPELETLGDLPQDVKRENRKGCVWVSGNTKPIKETLKAAGFKWSKKNNAWYRREAA